MRVDELVTAVRIEGRLSDSDTDFTSARIRQELTDTLKSVFGHAVVQAGAAGSTNAGHWLRSYTYTTTAGRTRYRLPYRAFAGAGHEVSLNDDVGVQYEIRGDQVVFETAPSAGGTLEIVYYLAPSALVQEQDVGVVASKDEDALTVTVDSTLPVNRVTTSTIATGDKLDIVHPNGWHELSLANVAGAISGLVITFPAGTDLSDVEAGDYVRAAEQTDWPAIPDDYHRALANLTAARIARAKGNRARADSLEKEAAGDVARFSDSIVPRIKTRREIVVPRYGMLRGRGRRRAPSIDMS